MSGRRHSTPLIDNTPWAMLCAGVRKPAKTRVHAETLATSELSAWAALGYRRSARIVYRDGTEYPFEPVATTASETGVGRG